MRLISTYRFRDFWYCFIIWVMTFVIASVVALPWFYLILPLFVFWTTVIYFRKAERSLTHGLALAIFWFVVIFSLSMLSIIGPYYHNAIFYFSDLRNLIVYPLVLIIPFIYALVLDNAKAGKILKRGRLGHLH